MQLACRNGDRDAIRCLTQARDASRAAAAGGGEEGDSDGSGGIRWGQCQDSGALVIMCVRQLLLSQHLCQPPPQPLPQAEGKEGGGAGAGLACAARPSARAHDICHQPPPAGSQVAVLRAEVEAGAEAEARRKARLRALCAKHSHSVAVVNDTGAEFDVQLVGEQAPAEGWKLGSRLSVYRDSPRVAEMAGQRLRAWVQDLLDRQ
jgi:hypothetical protein